MLYTAIVSMKCMNSAESTSFLMHGHTCTPHGIIPFAWRTWSRSSVPTRIALSKTTMLIEAHWKVLKRNHLYHFNRARLDLLVYVIIERYGFDLLHNFKNKAVLRREPSSWEKNFFKEWRKALRDAPAERPDAEVAYRPSIDNSVCGCETFINNQFLLCKHLVRRSTFGTINYRRHLVLRKTTPPFVTILEVSSAQILVVCVIFNIYLACTKSFCLHFNRYH